MSAEPAELFRFEVSKLNNSQDSILHGLWRSFKTVLIGSDSAAHDYPAVFLANILAKGKNMGHDYGRIEELFYVFRGWEKSFPTSKFSGILSHHLQQRHPGEAEFVFLLLVLMGSNQFELNSLAVEQIRGVYRDLDKLHPDIIKKHLKGRPILAQFKKGYERLIQLEPLSLSAAHRPWVNVLGITLPSNKQLTEAAYCDHYAVTKDDPMDYLPFAPTLFALLYVCSSNRLSENKEAQIIIKKRIATDVRQSSVVQCNRIFNDIKDETLNLNWKDAITPTILSEKIQSQQTSFQDLTILISFLDERSFAAMVVETICQREWGDDITAMLKKILSKLPEQEATVAEDLIKGYFLKRIAKPSAHDVIISWDRLSLLLKPPHDFKEACQRQLEKDSKNILNQFLDLEGTHGLFDIVRIITINEVRSSRDIFTLYKKTATNTQRNAPLLLTIILDHHSTTREFTTCPIYLIFQDKIWLEVIRSYQALPEMNRKNVHQAVKPAIDRITALGQQIRDGEISLGDISAIRDIHPDLSLPSLTLLGIKFSESDLQQAYQRAEKTSHHIGILKEFQTVCKKIRVSDEARLNSTMDHLLPSQHLVKLEEVVRSEFCRQMFRSLENLNLMNVEHLRRLGGSRIFAQFLEESRNAMISDREIAEADLVLSDLFNEDGAGILSIALRNWIALEKDICSQKISTKEIFQRFDCETCSLELQYLLDKHFTEEIAATVRRAFDLDKNLKAANSIANLIRSLAIPPDQNFDIARGHLIKTKDTLVLSDVSFQLENLNIQLGPALRGSSPLTLELLLALDHCQDLIDFFKEFSDPALYQDCLDHTDDNEAVDAVTELKATHTFLSKILKSQNFESLCQELSRVKIGRLDIQRLDRVIKTLSQVRKMIDQISMNSERRADQDLQDISKPNSAFVISRKPNREKKVFLGIPGEENWNVDKLEDLRNRLLLVAKQNAERKKSIDMFKDQLERIKLIDQVLSQLHDSGNFDYQEYEFKFPMMEESLEEWDQKMNQWKQHLVEYKKDAEELKRKHPYLYFFTRPQLIAMHVSLEEGKPLKLLRFVRQLCLKIDIASLASPTLMWRKSPKITALDKLASLGLFLDLVVSQLNLRPNKPLKKIASRHRWAPLRPNSINAVIVPQKEQVLNYVTAVYLEREYFPEPYELLFCNASTPHELVHSFFLRCLLSTKHNRDRTKPFYTMINFQDLSPSVQRDTIQDLETLFGESQDQECLNYSLLLLGVDGQGHLTTYCQPYILPKFVPIQEEELRAIYHRRVSDATRGVIVVHSERALLGKSRFIQSRAKTEGGEYVKISINQTLTLAQLIHALSSHRHEKTIFHFNLSSTATSEINFQLFQLFVVGSLSDYDGNQYDLRKEDMFFLELPSLQDATWERFFVCRHLPQESISIENFAVSKDGMFQHVSKMLRLWHHNRPQFVALESLNTQAMPTLSNQDCLNIITTVFHNKGRPVTEANFSMMVTAVRYLDVQFGIMEKSGFFHVSSLKEMQGGTHLRNLVLESLLQMSLSISERCLNVDQVKQDKLWENDNHCMLLFNYPINGNLEEAGDLSLIYRRKETVPSNYVTTLASQSLRGSFSLEDYMSCSSQKLLEDLCKIVGARMPDGIKEYALTLDNCLKMIAIHLRMVCGIPVVVMGHAGCGKSALIGFLCRLINIEFRPMNIHGGITEQDIVQFMEKVFQESSASSKQFWIFFDEVNTCDCMGLFKEIICDRTINGKMIPEKVKTLAACNPYIRYKKKLETIGLVFRHAIGSESDIQDALRDLVYRVHPLPHSMSEYVWDYGQVEGNEEMQYIRAIISKYDGARIAPKGFAELMSMSHRFIRTKCDGRYLVSLRDVDRCVRLYFWLIKFLKIVNAIEPIRFHVDDKTTSLIVCLSISYFIRLDEAERKDFSLAFGQEFNKHRSIIDRMNGWIIILLDSSWRDRGTSC
eukprot:TRINITY_DN2247_c0_g1_i2.p1 TRINITY_DN2247_c0_g1~~TRINITY_DN2247_c0_g1_i2.p1  ORF type:complete len:1952 (+),score=519.45 TRINITY_DN2247_c0_g1_i2:40-5856(+)